MYGSTHASTVGPKHVLLRKMDDHKTKRKMKKLTIFIPKVGHRCLDKYLRMKLEELRRDVPLDTREEYNDPMPPHNSVLARTPRYTAPINFL